VSARQRRPVIDAVVLDDAPPRAARL